MNNTGGRTAWREVFLSWCGMLYLVRTFLSFFFIPLGPLSLFLWGLVLFIEALVLFPNNEREGHQQLAILKGNIWYKLS